MNAADLEALESWLHAEVRAEKVLPLDVVQGLLAAVVSAPEVLPASRWFDTVFGEDFEFENEVEANRILALLMDLHNDVARQLNEGLDFDFILYDGGEEGDSLPAWCDGYLMGVQLAEPSWESLAGEEETGEMLFPFMLLSGGLKEEILEAGEEWMSEEQEAKLRAEARENLVDVLMDNRAYWFERSLPETVRREGPKVGRNDPCPCGSGRKFKKCCGASAPTD